DDSLDRARSHPGSRDGEYRDLPRPRRAPARPARRGARQSRCRADLRGVGAYGREGSVVTSVYEWLRETLMSLSYEDTGFWTLLPDSFQYGFVINALLCALVIGPLLGAVGTLVVMKRMAFFSQAIGNAAMTGVAIGVLLGEPYTEPYVSMFAFCILFGLVLNYTKGRTRLSSDTLIGVFLSISLAVGASLLLFVSARVNTHILEAVLFGSVLTV